MCVVVVDTQEAHTLYQHAQTVDLPAEDRVQQTSYVEPSQNMDCKYLMH